MLSISSRKAAFAPELTLAFGGISVTYAIVGTLLFPARSVFINNLTDVSVTFTTDASEDQVTLGTLQGKEFEITANKTTENGFFFPAGTVFYAKGTSASSGGVYISYIYGK